MTAFYDSQSINGKPVNYLNPETSWSKSVYQSIAYFGRQSSMFDWSLRGVTFAIPAAFLAIVILQPALEPKWMFMDPMTAAQLSGECCHPHYGFVSIVGVLIWIATAAACGFTAMLLYYIGRRDQTLIFAATAALFTFWLAIDDAFLLHETVFPMMGVSQNTVLAIYVLTGLLYVFLNWRIIRDADFWLLAVSCFMMCVTLVIDVAINSTETKWIVLEDSAKFFGLCFWASFHISTMARELVEQ